MPSRTRWPPRSLTRFPEVDLSQWLPDGVGEQVGERARTVVASVVRDQTRDLLASDGAQTVWDTTLRLSHEQIVATLRGADTAAIQVDGEDRLVLDVTPVWDATRAKLVGIGLPEGLLPEREVEIDLADGASVAALQRAVGLFDVVATWMLPLGLVAAAGCVLVARRRRFAGYWLAAAVGVVAAAHAIAFALAPRLLTLAMGEVGALLRGVVTRTLTPPLWTFGLLAGGCAVVIAALIWTGRRTQPDPEPA